MEFFYTRWVFKESAFKQKKNSYQMGFFGQLKANKTTESFNHFAAHCFGVEFIYKYLNTQQRHTGCFC